jgi:outer membrane protein OmpA-like peptidoglycan-associated protein
LLCDVFELLLQAEKTKLAKLGFKLRKMKKRILFVLLFVCTLITYAQDVIESNTGENIAKIESAKPDVLTANFDFVVTDTGVNSKQHEYGSGFFKQKYIIISAKKVGGIGGTKDPLTGEPHTQIYCATIKKTGDLDRPLLYSRILNTNDNEGTITFSPNQQVVYYTRSLLGDKRNYQLYRAKDPLKRGQWLEEKKIHFSSSKYSIENPYVSEDGKTMYFASDMPGGEGGYDLYSANINQDGTIDNPVNLGEAVNTANDERSPYVDDNNKYLYFASNGHNTIGGLDVFRARSVKGKFVRVLNLGPTINTPEDDYAFMLANEKRGYVTSAKEGGEGGSDVYKLRLNYNKQLLKGFVKDALTNEKITTAEIKVVDTDGNEVDINTTKTGEFSAYVDPYEVYTITTNKEGYNQNVLELPTNSATERVFKTEVSLEQTPPEIVEVDGKSMIKIENIYFAFDKAVIKEDSKVSLNKIVNVLNDNPLMKIEVNAHTDIRGSAPYNLALSKRRAASTMKYLISKGISKDRLISEGYGESQTIINCEGRECSDEEHELNRRIEFVIVPE